MLSSGITVSKLSLNAVYTGVCGGCYCPLYHFSQVLEFLLHFTQGTRVEINNGLSYPEQLGDRALKYVEVTVLIHRFLKN